MSQISQQQAVVDKVVAILAGGYCRIRNARIGRVRTRAIREWVAAGYSDAEAYRLYIDARDMAELEMIAANHYSTQ